MKISLPEIVFGAMFAGVISMGAGIGLHNKLLEHAGAADEIAGTLYVFYYLNRKSDNDSGYNPAKDLKNKKLRK